MYFLSLFFHSWLQWMHTWIHESTYHPPSRIWESARRLTCDHKGAISVNPQQIISNQTGWIAPPTSIFKMNVDGTTSMDNRHSSIGVVIRDSNSMVSAAITKILPAQYNVQEVGVIALENGFYLPRKWIPHMSSLNWMLSPLSTNPFNQRKLRAYLVIFSNEFSLLLMTLKVGRSRTKNREFNRVAHELAHLCP